MNHNEQIRLILADDHAIVRDGLRRLLEDKPNLKIVGQASDGDETITPIEARHSDPRFVDAPTCGERIATYGVRSVE